MARLQIFHAREGISHVESSARVSIPIFDVSSLVDSFQDHIVADSAHNQIILRRQQALQTRNIVPHTVQFVTRRGQNQLSTVTSKQTQHIRNRRLLTALILAGL
ncbi:unnamed protein product, partial [Ectocarpus sp. 12 AP-2014]